MRNKVIAVVAIGVLALTGCTGGTHSDCVAALDAAEEIMLAEGNVIQDVSALLQNPTEDRVIQLTRSSQEAIEVLNNTDYVELAAACRGN